MAALSAFKRCRILYNRSILIQQCLKHKVVSTHYDVLGVSRSATAVEIKNAYIKMTKELHPDKSDKLDNGDNDDFIKVQEAYTILSRDQDKKDYDSLIFAAEDYQKYRQLRYGSGDDYITMKGPDTSMDTSKMNVFYITCILLVMLWVTLASTRYYKASVATHQIAATRSDWDLPTKMQVGLNADFVVVQNDLVDGCQYFYSY